MLHAIPRRAARAPGARRPASTVHAPEWGTNVIPRKMTRDQLRERLRRVMNDLVEPESFFDRLDSLM